MTSLYRGLASTLATSTTVPLEKATETVLQEIIRIFWTWENRLGINLFNLPIPSSQVESHGKRLLLEIAIVSYPPRWMQL